MYYYYYYYYYYYVNMTADRNESLRGMYSPNRVLYTAVFVSYC
jgi:hypothetical protein